MTAMTLRRRRAGFTILELVISMTILSVVLGASTLMLLKVQQQYTSRRGVAGTSDQLRSIELTLMRLFQTARANPKNITAVANLAMVVNPIGRSGSTWDNVELRADFNPVDGTVNGNLENVRIELTKDTVFVRWKKGGTAEPIAYPVKELRFQFYRLDGTEITNVTAAGDSARRVRVTIGIPSDAQSAAIIRRETWLSLRN
jgi:prepilin-type N-terminal cleavage/methylation domain-containing protein